MNKLRTCSSVITGTGLLLLGLSLTACATADDAEMDSRPDSTEKSETPTATLEERLEIRQRARKKMPEKIPSKVPVTVTGEVPDRMLSQVVADLATRINAQPEELEIIGAEAVVWPDGSLGCPKPDQTYTQALVPGYRIVLRYVDKQYDYRASETGYFFLCERPFLTRPERKPTQ
jgi:hypothetical protein